MKNSTCKGLSLLSASIAVILLLSTAVPVAVAAEGWKATFDEICSKTDASGSMSISELTGLVERLDKLQPVIEGSDDPAKKIYLHRLKKCRAMYGFMIDSKKETGK